MTHIPLKNKLEVISDPTEFEVGPTSKDSLVVPNMISSLHLCSKCCKLFHGKIRCPKKYRALTDTSSPLVLHIYSLNGIFHFNSVSIFDRLVYPGFTLSNINSNKGIQVSIPVPNQLLRWSTPLFTSMS